MVVVEKEGKYGVINSDSETIIGTKYTNIVFDEYTKNFIIKNSNNKVGVINKKGEAQIEPLYDEIKIINYSPILYEVSKNNKVGILDEKAQIIINIEYNGFGYPGNTENNINPLLLVPNINQVNGIIAEKDGKYGILNLQTGEKLLDFVGDMIYMQIENGEEKYKIEVERKYI